MKYVGPMAMNRAHPSRENNFYKCIAGLKNLLMEYLMMQDRHLTGKIQFKRPGKKSKK